MSLHKTEPPPFPEPSPDDAAAGCDPQHSRRSTGTSSAGGQNSPTQPARFSSRDTNSASVLQGNAEGRRTSDNPKEEVDPAKIHATRAMWQQKLDEKLAKKEQEEYDAELKEVRRRQIENERETRKFLRKESQGGSVGELSHHSLSVGSIEDLQKRGRSLSNSSRERGGSGLFSVSPSLSPPAHSPGLFSSSTPLDLINEEERARRQEDEDLLVAQRLQEEEALAASAAYDQPGMSPTSDEGRGREGEPEGGLGESPGEERRGGEDEQLDPDFLLAMQLQEQAHREAQQEADSLLAARLQNEEAALAAGGGGPPLPPPPPQPLYSPQGYYCPGQPPPPPCGQPSPFTHGAGGGGPMPAYRTTGSVQSVPQREGVQRIQTVAAVSPPPPPSRPSAGGGGGGVRRKKRGFFSRLFGRKKDK